MEIPEEELNLVKNQDDYEIAEDKVFHAIEDAEKAALHTIENAEKAAVHAIEDEVGTLFHGLNGHKKITPESEEKVKKVKHFEGPMQEILEEMMWGSLE